jgi:putative oxidoreductase
MYPDLGVLILRIFVGMVVIAHGLQKFGFLGGYGIAGTAGWLESIGFKPGRFWVWIVALAEVGGGSLLVIGLGGPIGPGLVFADLAVASIGFHGPNGFWNANNGWSWVSVIMAASLSIALIGFGAYSIDAAGGLTYPDWLLPAWLIAVALVGVVALVLQRSQTAAARAAEADTES